MPSIRSDGLPRGCFTGRCRENTPIPRSPSPLIQPSLHRIAVIRYRCPVTSATDDLKAAVAQAITIQIPADVDESQLPKDLAIHLTADRLVREALAAGHAGVADISEVTAFGAGNTAMMVARVHAQMAYVVKVDTSPSIVREAHLLRRMTSDPMLPAVTRAAFPAVFAIDDTPPLFGYLMELVEDAEPLHLALRRQDDSAPLLITGLWEQVLVPAYKASKNTRLAHNLHEDYFARARGRLQAAADADALPGGDVPIKIYDGSRNIEISGWSRMLDHADKLLATVKPPFGTWVHGDPNPENALWFRQPDGSVGFRMLDPKDWWIGDYIFDAAKLGHYAVVTAPTEAGVIDGVMSRTEGKLEITYDSAAMAWGKDVEVQLLARVGEFANMAGDRDWEKRYQLAFAANLLGIAGPRAMKAKAERNSEQKLLATVALGAGLATLADVIGK